MSLFDRIPTEILGEILSFIRFAGSDWLHVKLVNTRWKQSADRVFNPVDCNGLERLINIYFHFPIPKCAGEDVILKLLEDRRIDPSQHNKTLEYAIRSNSLKLLDHLLKDPRCDPNDCFAGYCWYALSACRQTEMIDRVMDDPRIDPSTSSGAFVMGQACVVNNMYLAKRLLQDERYDPSDFDNAAIGYACLDGRLEVVQLLLQCESVDPSARDHSAIKFASANNHLDIVNLLLQDERVDPTAQDNWALKEAQERGHTRIVERLLQDPKVAQALDLAYNT